MGLEDRSFDLPSGVHVELHQPGGDAHFVAHYLGRSVGQLLQPTEGNASRIRVFFKSVGAVSPGDPEIDFNEEDSWFELPALLDDRPPIESATVNELFDKERGTTFDRTHAEYAGFVQDMDSAPTDRTIGCSPHLPLDKISWDNLDCDDIDVGVHNGL